MHKFNTILKRLKLWNQGSSSKSIQYPSGPSALRKCISNRKSFHALRTQEPQWELWVACCKRTDLKICTESAKIFSIRSEDTNPPGVEKSQIGGVCENKTADTQRSSENSTTVSNSSLFLWRETMLGHCTFTVWESQVPFIPTEKLSCRWENRRRASTQERAVFNGYCQCW